MLPGSGPHRTPVKKFSSPWCLLAFYAEPSKQCPASTLEGSAEPGLDIRQCTGKVVVPLEFLSACFRKCSETVDTVQIMSKDTKTVSPSQSQTWCPHNTETNRTSPSALCHERVRQTGPWVCGHDKRTSRHLRRQGYGCRQSPSLNTLIRDSVVQMNTETPDACRRERIWSISGNLGSRRVKERPKKPVQCPAVPSLSSRLPWTGATDSGLQTGLLKFMK